MGRGLHLGRVWAGLGPLLGALGRFLTVIWAFKVELLYSIGPRWAPRGLLDRFGVDLGAFGEGFGRILEASWALLGPFLDSSEQIMDVFDKIWPYCSRAYKWDPRADPRSVTMRGGPPQRG